MNRRKNKKDWMINVCERPHLLVWAKIESYPYWPAKVMSYNDKHVSVEFFDEHSTAEVEVGNCLLYSKEYPLNRTPPASITAAIMVMLKHVSRFNFRRCISSVFFCVCRFQESRKNVVNIIFKFGAFHYAGPRVPLDLKVFDEQLRSMIPNWSTETLRNGANKSKRSEDGKMRAPSAPIVRVHTMQTARTVRTKTNPMTSQAMKISSPPLSSSAKGLKRSNTVSSAPEKTVPTPHGKIEEDDPVEIFPEDPLKLPATHSLDVIIIPDSDPLTMDMF